MDPATLGIIFGAAQTGISAYTGAQGGKLSKSARRRQKAVWERKYKQDLTEMEFQAADINRNAANAVEDSDENAMERGVFDSSIRHNANDRINAERDRRLAAMERQKGYMAADLKDNDYMLNLQDKMGQLQQLQQIANGIGGGVGAVDWGAAFGGGNSGTPNQWQRSSFQP